MGGDGRGTSLVRLRRDGQRRDRGVSALGRKIPMEGPRSFKHAEGRTDMEIFKRALETAARKTGSHGEDTEKRGRPSAGGAAKKYQIERRDSQKNKPRPGGRAV